MKFHLFNLALLFSVLFCSCSITSRNGDYQKINDWPPAPKQNIKPSITLKIQSQKFMLPLGIPLYSAKVNVETQVEKNIEAAFTDNNIEEKKYRSSTMTTTNILENKILQAYVESGLFSKIYTHSSATSDLTVDVRLDSNFNSIANFCCSCCFLDIIPTFSDYHNNLITTIKAPDGAIVGSYSLSESISQKRHILLFVAAPFTRNTEEVFTETIFDLCRATLIKANKDITKFYDSENN